MVLKVAWPHREARAEAAGLRAWHGDGEVRLHAADQTRFALLTERCLPGTPLSEAHLRAEDALRAGGEVLTRLWRATHRADEWAVGDPTGFERLGDVTAEWASLVRTRARRHRPRVDPGLVEHGARLLETLPGTASRTVLLHGDANPGNMLAADRAPSLEIDATPMIGDPGYDPAPLVAPVDPPFDHADPTRVLADRYAVMAEVVGVPTERLLAWAVARSVESALWTMHTGDPAGGHRELTEAAVLAGLLGL